MTDYPPPLVPKDVDLRNFADMPLEVMRLRDSDLRRLSTGDEFKAGIVLWCAAWHQMPAGSLPDNDTELADLAAIGTGKPAVRAWLKLRAMALRGWVRCSDGRLYHPRMAQKAVTAWKAKRARVESTMKARLASLAKAIASEKDPNRKAQLQVEHDALLREAQQALSLPVSPPLSQGQPQALSQGAVQGVLDDLSQGGIEGKGSEGSRSEHESRTPSSSPDVSPRERAAATTAQEDSPSGDPQRIAMETMARKVRTIDGEALAQAIRQGDPLAVVRVFHCSTEGDQAREWLGEIDDLAIGLVAILFAWRRADRDHIRMPSGFRRARAAWRELPQAEQIRLRDSLLTEFGIALGEVVAP